MSKKPPIDSGDQKTDRHMNQNTDPIDGGEDVVIDRRIDKRLRNLEATDRPWLRRIVGSLIILISAYAGWKMMGARTEEVKREMVRLQGQIPAPTPATSSSPTLNAASESKTQAFARAQVEGGALVDTEAANTISECTKGVDAFRNLKLDAASVATGQLSLEQVFSPVLREERGLAKRVTSLENIHIRTRDGKELRLHITPRDQKGRLYAQLFRVADDGLPEEMDFPETLVDLKTNPITKDLRFKFLQLADPPGVPLETERHESWSFADKSGAQLIVANDFIFDMQVFTKDRFLACVRAQGKSVCKCVDKK